MRFRRFWGVCKVRSYEGEPAMKLESAALSGKDVLQLEPQIYGNILGTSYLLKAVYENLGKVSVADLAYSAHVYLAKGLAALAIEQAQEQGTKNVGFTGGAACNQILAQTIREAVEAAGLQFYVHESGSGRRRRNLIWTGSCRIKIVFLDQTAFIAPKPILLLSDTYVPSNSRKNHVLARRKSPS